MSWLISGVGRAPTLFQIASTPLSAYSLRQLDLIDKPVVRVRRSSDNAEQDFTATQVSDGTLTTFCGAGNGFVRTWYDQGLSGTNLQQTTTASQPKIVTSGSLVQQGGKPSILYEGSQSLGLGNAPGESAAYFLVSKHDNPSSSWSWAIHAGAAPSFGKRASSTNLHLYFNQVSFADASPVSDISQYAVSYFQQGLVNAFSVNNSGPHSRTPGTVLAKAQWRVGARASQLDEPWFGHIQEIIYYGEFDSNKRTNIVTNINAHYNIF
jgi:hypothetical protein